MLTRFIQNFANQPHQQACLNIFQLKTETVVSDWQNSAIVFGWRTVKLPNSCHAKTVKCGRAKKKKGTKTMTDISLDFFRSTSNNQPYYSGTEAETFSSEKIKLKLKDWFCLRHEIQFMLLSFTKKKAL